MPRAGLDDRRPYTIYHAEFITTDGSKRTVVGATEKAIADRTLEYAMRGTACPAFAKPAKEPPELVRLGTAPTERQAYLWELAWFGWMCQGLPDWELSCRGACFVLPTMKRWDEADTDACRRLVSGLPRARGKLTPQTVTFLQELACSSDTVAWHLEGLCFRCGSSEHRAKACPKGKPGPSPKQPVRKQKGRGHGWGGARDPCGRKPIAPHLKVQSKSGKSSTSGTQGNMRRRRKAPPVKR